MATFEEAAAKLSIKTALVSLIMGALGFLVALQWRDTIQKTIDEFVPPGEGLAYSYTVTIIITMAAIAAAYLLSRLESFRLVPGKKVKGQTAN